MSTAGSGPSLGTALLLFQEVLEVFEMVWDLFTAQFLVSYRFTKINSMVYLLNMLKTLIKRNLYICLVFLWNMLSPGVILVALHFGLYFNFQSILGIQQTIKNGQTLQKVAQSS